MENTSILISIIVPVYNVERYINQCLLSIYDQGVDINKFEVIIVNDGTKDNSMQIVESYKKYKNLTVITQLNQGLSCARNNGFKQAKGKYVWFVDSDDLLLDGSISTILGIIEKDDHTDVIASVLQCYKEETKTSYLEYKVSDYSMSGKEYLWKGYSKGAIQRFVMKKDFLESNNLLFYPGILHEDSLFANQMLYLAKTLILLPEPIYVYRKREGGSIMSSISIKSAYDLLFIYNTLIEFMDNKVRAEDKIQYKISLNLILYSIMLFCVGIYDSEVFKTFYKENVNFIRKESFVLFRNHRKWKMALLMCFFPKQMVALKVTLKSLKSNLKKR